MLEAVMRGERVEAVISVPPRMGKTETVLLALAWLLSYRPEETNAYVSYAADFAFSKSRRCREIMRMTGRRPMYDANKLGEWRVAEGGGLLATGMGGIFEGKGVDRLLVVDDPIKNPEVAHSRLQRDKHYEWFQGSAEGRREPGSSCIILMARWHPDDLAGRKIKDGYDHINLPALDASDASLWPERWSSEELIKKRDDVSPYFWANRYLGKPVAQEGTRFDGAYFYNELPAHRRVCIGLDLAYTEKRHSDYNVALAMAKNGTHLYAMGGLRVQARAPDFAEQLRRFKGRWPGAPIVIYSGPGPEQGVIDVFKRILKLPIRETPATRDKIIRSERAATLWNKGAILWPEGERWTEPFLGEIADFTGLQDAHDDVVDAMAAAVDELWKITSTDSIGSTRRRETADLGDYL
jgi:predicted phage terminase large subunit-like protein